MKKVSFIKDWDLLQEESRNNSDGFEKEFSDFYDYLDNLPKNKNSVVGFIGGFGTGKSTLMEKIKKEIGCGKCWQFDAWKYQDKSNLWKSFLLEFADDNINWSSRDWLKRKLLGKKYIIGQILIVFIFSILSIFLKEYKNWDFWFISILPPLGVLLSNLIIDLPLEHLSELQKEFNGFIGKNREEKFIFLEDIDRAGSSGIHFLETLSFLLRNSEVDRNRVIVIATIGKGRFFGSVNSYEKCLDQIYFSQLPRPNIKIFMDKVFDESYFNFDDNSRLQINRFLVELVGLPDGNIRKIKLLLRDAAVVYEKLSNSKNGDKYDWRMVIAFVAMKYYRYGDEVQNENYAQYFQRRLFLEKNNPFGKLFLAIARKTDDLNPQQGDNLTSFKFDEHTSSAIPDVPRIPEQPSAGSTQGKIGMHYKEIMHIS